MKQNHLLVVLIGILLLTSLGMTVQAKPESAASLIDAIESFQQVAPGTGWILFSGQLYWTRDNGAAWTDITPDSSGRIEAVTFLDTKRGWTVLADADGYSLASTRDGGKSWKIDSLDLSALENADAPIAELFMNWDSESRGWLSFKLATGSNFDRRINFVTADGGVTWTEDARGGFGPASGDPLEVTNEAGWALSQSGECASGTCAREVELMSTRDGVKWTAIRLPNGQFSLTENISLAPKAFVADSDTKPYVGQGFDKCEMASLAQMQAWWNSSPYNAVNLYFGGVSRGCANSLIDASFLSSLRAQGWRFIPTWVGLQASCSGYAHRMSPDTGISYQQGKDEATAAIAAAQSLGLTNPDGSGTVIYYDLEAYNTSNTECRASANEFINGWTQVIQAAGNLAGVYGASCGSAPADWWDRLNYKPDALWIANWYDNPPNVSYTRTATVWNAACLSNALWPNHQRLRQYAGTHTETWGGVAFSIDSNVLDGPLTVTNGTGDTSAPSTPSNPNPAESATITRANDTWLTWRTNADTCSVHVWGGALDTNLVGDCAMAHLGPQGPGAYSWQVTATNGFGSTLGPVWGFGVQPNPPANLNATPVSATRVNLNWTLSSDEPNVDSYNIFADGNQMGAVAAGVNNFQAQNLSCNTSHAFTVKAVYQGIQSGASNTANATTGSCAPVLVSPIGGVLVDSVQPTFVWEAVGGAAYYQIQISTSAAFSTYTVNARVYATSYTPTVALLANKIYYWRARAIGSFGTGDWASSTFMTPNPPPAPGLLVPAANALVTDYSPVFDWKDVTAPTGTTLDHYQIQVASTAAFVTPVVDENVIASTFTPLTDLQPNTKYYWRVRAVNTLGHMGAWSQARYFRSAILPTTLLSPADGASVLTLRPAFDWTDVSGASGYTLQISTSVGFASVLKTYSPVASSVSPTTDLPVNATLYWRVRANGTNGPSLWSETRSFVTPNPPKVPVLSSPANRALVSDLTPRLAWRMVTVPAGTTFDHYQLQVATDAAFALLVLDQSVFTLSPSEFTLVTPLLPAKKYYWRVLACNTDGACSAWSAAWVFQTTSTATP